MKKKNFILSMMLFILFSISNYISALSDEIDVSVIVPIYNVEKYLDECLDSIENQTKTDGVEIICIDDGSTDKSSEILKKHAEKNDKIKVITQENQGVSVARNQGLENAKGKYIMFVDSDDLLLPYAIEKAYQTAEKYNVDVVRFSAVTFRDGRKFNMDKYKYNDSKIFYSKRNMSQNPFEIWRKYKIQPFVWNKIWKRDFIERNNFSFKKGIKLEDSLFVCLSIPKLSEIVFDNNPLYAYRVVRKNSIMYDLNRNGLDKLQCQLIISEQLVHNRNVFDFKDSDNWIISSIISRYHDNKPKIFKKKEEIYYSKKFLELVENFIEKYNIKVSEKNRNKINNLRKLSENI